MSKKSFADSFVAVGRALPIQKQDRSTPVKGVKVCLFQEDNDKMVDYNTAVIVWKRDLEDVLSGRIPFAVAYRGADQVDKAQIDKAVEVPASIKPSVRTR